jgi:hypothetical protein
MAGIYLLGLHDAAQAFLIEDYIRSKGHKVHRCSSWDELLTLSRDGFTDCVMDLNYKRPDPHDISPALVIKSGFKGRLVVISTRPNVVEEAKKQGLDARDKMEFMGNIDSFLAG